MDEKRAFLMIPALLVLAGCNAQGVLISKIAEKAPLPPVLSVSQSASQSAKETAQTLLQTLPAPGTLVSAVAHDDDHDHETLPPSVPIDPHNPPMLVVQNLTPVISPPSGTPTVTIDSPSNTGSSSSSSGGGSSSTVAGHSVFVNTSSDIPQPNKILTISKIYISEKGPIDGNIVGPDAPSFLTPSYLGKQLNITIEGDFKTAPPAVLDSFLFTLEPPMIQQSLAEKMPAYVAIDETILWSPLEISSTTLKMSLSTRGILDLFMRGPHTLTVSIGQLYSQVKVAVGAPDPSETPPSLSPTIDKVEVLTDPKTNLPQNLKITGKNLLMYYKYSYAQISGSFVFCHSTNVLDTANGLVWEQIIHLPPGFVDNGKNTISLSTPYGAVFKSF